MRPLIFFLGKLECMGTMWCRPKQPSTSGEIQMSDATPRPTVELLTLEQVATLCNVSQPTIRRLMKSSVFPASIRLGNSLRGTIRFRRADIESWIKDGCPSS